MEKLIYTAPKAGHKTSYRIKELVLSLLLGAGAFSVLISSFDLNWTPSEWADGGIGSGLAKTWNQIADTLGNTDGIFLDKLAGAGSSSGLFLTVCFILLVIISWLIVKSRNNILLIIYPLVLILPPVIFGLSPSGISTALMVAAVIAVTADTLVSEKNGFVHLAFVAAVALIAVAITYIPPVSSFVDKPASVQKLSGIIEKAERSLYYGDNPLGDGDLTETKRITSDETALHVTMSEPDSLYLRGFVGEYYTTDQWRAMPNSIYYDNRNLMYWLEKDGFSGVGQIGLAGKLLDESDAKKTNNIEIENVNANKHYAYIPYEISKQPEESKLWGNSFITGCKYRKLSSYSYIASENQVKRWTAVAGQVFSKGEAGNLAAYNEAESYYNSYVYNCYTFIPSTYIPLLKESIGNAGDQSEGHIEYKTAIDRIRSYLTDNFIYTEDIGESGEKHTDALSRFIESKKGYDIHFATAAALMFRYYGIPARYVEGYLITPADVKGAKAGETVDISEKNAHSWVEIYVDGVGFVPIEVSPPYYGVMEEADMNVGISNDTLQTSFDETSENTPGNTDPQGSGGDEKSHPSKIWKIVMMAAGLIALLLLIVYLAVKAWRKMRSSMKLRRLFKSENPKQAVSAIYGYMLVKNLPVDEEAYDLGNKAAYSLHPITETQRSEMLAKLKVFKKEKRKNEKGKIMGDVTAADADNNNDAFRMQQ